MTFLWRRILAWWHCTCCESVCAFRPFFLPYESEYYCDTHLGCLTCPIHQPFQRPEEDTTRYVAAEAPYR